jgi:HAD superfamily hydrolase (TIGR01484 family)
MLSLRELLQHLGEEIESYRANGAAGWQGEERRINLYLFSCAIACTLDDYVAARRWNLSSLGRRLPRALQVVKAADTLLNAPYALVSRSPVARARAWRREWSACVDAVCELLLGRGEARFFENVRPLLIAAPTAIGEAAMKQRMRIPEAFRCQDLTHHDVRAMLNLCLPALPDKARPVVIVGPRTAGAYFAPLAAAQLRSLGYTQVTWVTVRPKNGLSAAEARSIRKPVAAGARVLIVDDHPNSGNTLRLLLGALRELGAESRDIVAVLPGHPAVPGWTLADETARGVQILLLPPEDRFKVQLLGEGFAGDPHAAVNAEFAAHYADGFQVRLKRVVTLDGRPAIAKSTGWGWLGYHAWLAGIALQGSVPRPLFLRDGVLFSEYTEHEGAPVRDEDPAKLAVALATYIARRVSALPLGEDPGFNTPGYRWCGWDDLVATLSRIYGPRFGFLKKRVIRHRLRHYVAPYPVLVDGHMKPAEWVRAGGTLLKTDYEQHNFGGGEPDIVDPAWDLASAAYEFRLTPDAERILLQSYIAKTADTEIPDRLLLYKILYTMTAVRAAQYWIARKPVDERRQEWNHQFIQARSFAAFQMARYCGRNLAPAPTAWKHKLFFLDLDGVLDWGLLGFPHTTPKGVAALQLLRRNGYAVVLNTARSLEHVREYCRAYKLPGGVAELGSVFYDAVRDWEVPLIDAEAVAQIERLRDAIQALPGVFIDPENRYSIRAYRFQGQYMHALAPAEIEEALRRTGCDGLTYVQSQADTYIIQKGAGKGAALGAVKAYLGFTEEHAAAMGDSTQDVDMLRAADIAYAPANACREVRELARRGECRCTRLRLQAGFLEAAMHLCSSAVPDDAVQESLIDDLLQVPDRGPLRRIFGVLRWWEL